jgi:hypothetical protein
VISESGWERSFAILRSIARHGKPETGRIAAKQETSNGGFLVWAFEKKLPLLFIGLAYVVA